MELLNRDPTFPQWARAKSPDSFGPVGPCIETEPDLAAYTAILTAPGFLQSLALSLWIASASSASCDALRVATVGASAASLAINVK